MLPNTVATLLLVVTMVLTSNESYGSSRAEVDTGETDRAKSELEQCRTTLRHVRALVIDTERLAMMSEEVTDQLFQVCGFLSIHNRDVDLEEEEDR